MYDESRLYPPDDPALAQIGSYSTLAQWRSQGKGPAFVRLGKRVAYTGRALNAWLDAQTVNPGAPQPETATAA